MSMKEQPAPTIDYRQVLKMHYIEFSKYLVAYLAASSPPNSRSNARSKLTRLTTDQFYMMSTDVYDEVMRRNSKENDLDEVPFLPAQEEFHPQRNHARQKLAILPPSRLEDLAGDVLFELGRRYPELRISIKEDMITSTTMSTSTSLSTPAGALISMYTRPMQQPMRPSGGQRSRVRRLLRCAGRQPIDDDHSDTEKLIS